MRSSTPIALATVLVLAIPARAGDGRIEINQASALAGGITPGDGPGFPVLLTAAGSYVLTSDLVPGQGLAAIDLRQEDITLDLNGFSLRGASPLGAVASGIVATQPFFPPQEATIRNGVIRGFRGRGIDLAASSHLRIHVEDVLVYDNEQGGLALGADGLVLRTRARENGLFGFQLGNRTAFGECSVTGTSGGLGVIGGVQLGGSYCDDGTCSPKPQRRYYLTEQQFTGSAALSACAPGFHFASLWEIHDTTAVRYETTLGFSVADSGSGPGHAEGLQPGSEGWVRTGAPSLSDGTTGGVGNTNCSAWTSASSTQFGTTVAPTTGWDLTVGELPNEIQPWTSSEVRCNTLTSVWCVEE